MRHAVTLAAVLALGLVAPAAAQAPQPVQQNNSNAIWFENWIGLRNAQMRIVAPDGTYHLVEAESGTPVFQLTGTEVLDGVWRYELSAATDKEEKIKNPIDNGRGENARDTIAVPFYTSGQFVVSRGVIVQPETIVEE
ncbi:hypothetical protein [Jannaschia seohaensis]|uniref:Uncharacterized protein n=1 Tax=Jannaschia seohaensis TaxID=475081 RepID=A0A2Y9B576_9RHOB|nr:hypothetical protein [Jannaschia seohaensis]PWJ15787.1 hypothetical protein BCF38_1107 [Jannaschia seohaensis]SSA49469.1 hypothetical protein SAMN05421539_1107 [Jannaschia seohaensis]